MTSESDHRDERVDNFLAVIIITLALLCVGYGLLSPLVTPLTR